MVASHEILLKNKLTSKATGQAIGCASGPRNAAGSQWLLEPRAAVAVDGVSLAFCFPRLSVFLFPSLTLLSSSLLLQLIYLFNISPSPAHFLTENEYSKMVPLTSASISP